MRMSRSEAIEHYGLSPEECYNVPDPEECPECGEQSLHPNGSENYGSDRDNRRGMKLYYHICSECGYEDSCF